MKFASTALLSWVLFSFGALLGQSQSEEGLSVLTVNGQGEVLAAADEATVRLGVSHQAERAREAQEQVNRVIGRIESSLEALSLESRQIQTSQVRLFPIYAQQKPGSTAEPRVVAYRATNLVSVNLEDLDAVGPVIDAALEAGANQLEEVRFGLREERPFKLRALVRAVTEASVKARAMAEALGVKLARILEVRESGVARPVGQAAMQGIRTMQMAEMAAPTSISPGELTVSASATIRYEIVPR